MHTRRVGNNAFDGPECKSTTRAEQWCWAFVSGEKNEIVKYNAKIKLRKRFANMLYIHSLSGLTSNAVQIYIVIDRIDMLRNV